MIGPARRERVAMMLMAGGLLAALSLSYVIRPPERVKLTMSGKKPASPRIVLASPPAGLSSPEVAKCRKVIAEATQDGIIRERPSSDRIDVDEDLWDRLAPGARGTIMQAMTCDQWQTVAPPPDHRVAAYGWSSGRRLATLSGVRDRR